MNDFDIDDFISQIHSISLKKNIIISNFTLLRHELLPPSGDLFNHIFSNNSIHSLLQGYAVTIHLKYLYLHIDFDIKLKFDKHIY
jgi:hypothetical protein